MKRSVKIGLGILSLLFVVGFALWYPYEIPSIPEWKLRIVDSTGKPMPSVQVGQEWLNPIEDGMTSSDDKRTDGHGTVVFPKRTRHNRLALGLAGRASARVIVCTQDEFGDAAWEGETSAPPATLILKHGPCPYD